MRPEDIARGRQLPPQPPSQPPTHISPPPTPSTFVPQYDPAQASTFRTGETRSPMTLAEWKLCKPGDTIHLLGYTVHITEENFEPFMNDIDWYVNWFEGDRLGNWILPNPNPSGRARFSQALTNAYIASGIIKALAKYADKGEKQPGFWDRLRATFGGVPVQ